jgi:hypothetical protein
MLTLAFVLLMNPELVCLAVAITAVICGVKS